MDKVLSYRIRETLGLLYYLRWKMPTKEKYFRDIQLELFKILDEHKETENE